MVDSTWKQIKKLFYLHTYSLKTLKISIWYANTCLPGHLGYTIDKFVKKKMSKVDDFIVCESYLLSFWWEEWKWVCITQMFSLNKIEEL